MDKLDAIDIFIQTADSGSFVLAAQRLGISGSAVGKAIGRLEDELRVRLFYRSTRSMALTDEGRLFLDVCRRIQSDYDSIRAQFLDTQSNPSGRVRVSLPLGGVLMMPVLADFMREYPNVFLDLDFTDRVVDVIDEGFDIAIRSGAMRDNRLMSRKLGTFRHAVVASPGYIEVHGRPEHPVELLQHACLHHRFANSGKIENWPLFIDGRAIPVALPVATVANSLDSLIYLAERSFGIACLPAFAITQKIAEGRLTSLMDSYVSQATTLHLLWPTSQYLSARVRAFIDFMSARLLPASL